MKRALSAACLFLAVSLLHAGGVVSLLPGITDMVLDLGEGGRLTGCTRYAVLPPGHPAVRLGGLYDLNVEALLRLKPDMVLAPREMAAGLATAQKAGIPVHLFRFTRLEEVLDTYQKVGHLLGKDALAAQRVAALHQLLNQPHLPGDPVQVLVITGGEWSSGGAIYAAGHSLFGELITRLGGQNAVTSSMPYPSLSREGILAMDPDVILILSTDAVRPLIPADSPLQALQAVRRRHVINIHGPKVLQPGPVLFRLAPAIRKVLKRYADHRVAPLPSYLAVD